VVVAVNRPLCPLTTALRKPARIGELFGKERLQELDENLYLFSPRYMLHDHLARRSPFLVRRNLNSLRRSYRSLTARLGVSEPRPLVWFYYPQQSYVTELFDASLRIYEIHDNLSDIFGSENTLLADLEREVRHRVDLLLTTSRALWKLHGANYPDAFHLGNGLDRESFDRFMQCAVEAAPEIQAINSPRIGFAGVISERLEWDILTELARRRPEWNFIFAGPIINQNSTAKMRAFPNAHFVGEFHQSQVPSVLKGFDIGLMPYLDTVFFRRSNPLKFYEYAAAGLPSVSSEIEELRAFPAELVTVAGSDPDRWEEALERYLVSDRVAVRAIGRDIARKFIWEDMTDSLLEKINSCLAKQVSVQK
ncbi:MAG: glycosyltransferase, partial [Candidatus Zixiibacteriota bacterium]